MCVLAGVAFESVVVKDLAVVGEGGDCGEEYVEALLLSGSEFVGGGASVGYTLFTDGCVVLNCLAVYSDWR